MTRLIRILILVFCFYQLAFLGRIFPFISVAGVDISGTTPEKAATILAEKTRLPEKIILKSENKTFEILPTEIGVDYDFTTSAQRAYQISHTGNVIHDLGKRMNLIFWPQNIGLSVKFDEGTLLKKLDDITKQIETSPVFPSASIASGSVVIEAGKAGTSVDTKQLRALIGQSLSLTKSEIIQIPIQKIDPTLNEEEVAAFKREAEKFLGKNLTFTFEFNAFDLKTEDILKLLEPKGGFNEEEIDKLAFKIAAQINREPQNPKFQFEAGRVTEFLPAKDGIELDIDKFKEVLTVNLEQLSGPENKSLSLEIPVKRMLPAVTTASVNNLGIKELIGRGTSKFRGSIPSRVHNIELASSRLNGTLIKPGEIFSFNNALGDVSKFTGYQEAYVIREGKTVLGDGGGVCQVSTTLFRAALDAGLPIIERQAHAYRVGYYEQDSPPGFDATVYGPSPDLKIKNDTPAHILIQAKTDKKNSSLVFELYGTADGRTATISKPTITNVVKPGEDLYLDDPTLPAGTIKQTEHRASGAKVTFNYLVKRGDETIYQKTFISNYRPWQAVYLRGTALH